MDKVKELAGLAAVTIFFGLLTWALISSYFDDYDLPSLKPATVQTAEKIGADPLLTPPSYYVRAELPSGQESPYLNRISKRQMENLQTGDPVSGYSASPSDFSTMRDILIDSAFYFLGISILGLITLCCLFATVLSFPYFEQPHSKAPADKRNAQNKKKRKKIRKTSKAQTERKGWRIAWTVVFLLWLPVVRFLLNLVRKLLPFGKTETEAMIFDLASDVTYRKHEDSTYELTIAFQDSAGRPIQVIKDVTRHTYERYDIGDLLPIAYRTANPYDVFVRGTDAQDLIQAAMTWEMFAYGTIIALTVFVGWAFLDSRKKHRP